jgi:NADPH2:quinone reductase
VGFADVAHANAELCAAPLDRLIPLPATVSCREAAAVLLQGMTAQYLVRDSFALRPGHQVLVHAAAGGVGLLLTQIARRLGAQVTGVCSSGDKAEAARVAGAGHVVAAGEGWAERARASTPDGRGFDVVYDSVGSTLDGSLAAARTGGAVVFYGMAGGEPPPVDPRRLMDESKTVTGGDLWNVLTSAEERRARAAELFGWMADGLRVRIAHTIALAEGARAHEFLEGRGVIGKIVLVP